MNWTFNHVCLQIHNYLLFLPPPNSMAIEKSTPLAIYKMEIHEGYIPRAATVYEVEEPKILLFWACNAAEQPKTCLQWDRRSRTIQPLTVIKLKCKWCLHAFVDQAISDTWPANIKMSHVPHPKRKQSSIFKTVEDNRGSSRKAVSTSVLYTRTLFKSGCKYCIRPGCVEAFYWPHRQKYLKRTDVYKALVECHFR